MSLLGEEVHQLLGVGGDGLVAHHAAEVVNPQQLLGGGVEPGGHVVLELLGHPDDPGDAALGGGELLRGDEVPPVAHEAGGLNAAAGHGGQLAEGHARGGHALVLPVDHHQAVGEGLNAADALEAAAAGHGVLHDGVQAHVLHRALGGGVDHAVHVGVVALHLVGAALLADGLAGTGVVELLGGLGVQPAHRAAQAQPLRRHHTAVAGGEGLAEDAGVELVHALIGHGAEPVVPGVVGGHGLLIQNLFGLPGIGDQGDLALVHHGGELVHNHIVQHLAEVLHPQALVVGVVGDADAELVALAGVHHALHVVEPGVDLPLDDGLKVLLHLRAVDLDIGGQGVLHLAAVDVGAVHHDPVVLHLGGIPHGHQLAGGVLAGPELHLHVRLADDFALEGGGEGHGDGQLLHLDVDVPQGQGALAGLSVIQLGLQRAGDLEVADVLVHDHREAQGDGARACGDHHGVQSAEGVDEGGDAVLGVFEEARQVAGLDVAENEGGADGHGDHMNNAGHVMAQGHHAKLQAHLHALLQGLLDALADHKGEDALGLVILDHIGHVLGIVRLAQHHGHAGDVPGDQGHAQGTDDGIGHEPDAGVFGVGFAAAHVFQSLDDLRAHGGGKARVQGRADVVLIGDEALQNAHTGGQVAQGLHLHAGSGVDGGEEVGGVGESHRRIRAVLGDGVVDGSLGQARHGVGTAIDQISQSAHMENNLL